MSTTSTAFTASADLFNLLCFFQDVENRRIRTMQCSIQRNQDKKDTKDLSIRILLRMEVWCGVYCVLSKYSKFPAH